MKQLRWLKEKCRLREGCDHCIKVCPKGVLSTDGSELFYCRHCEPAYAACIRACVLGGLAADKSGIIRKVEFRCDGCAACVGECQTKGIVLRNKDGKQVIEKCDLCAGVASEPFCVSVCPYRALEVFDSEQAMPGGEARRQATANKISREQEKAFELNFVGDGKNIATVCQAAQSQAQSAKQSAQLNFRFLELPNRKLKLLESYDGRKIYEAEDIGNIYCIDFPGMSAEDWRIMEQAKYFTISELADRSMHILSSEKQDKGGRLAFARDVAERMLCKMAPSIQGEKRQKLAELIAFDSVGFGPVELFWPNDVENIEELEINHPLREMCVFHRKYGRCITNIRLAGEAAFRRVINSILLPIGASLDDMHPTVDAQLPDGSRLHAQIYPFALSGAAASIRFFSNRAWTITKLIDAGTLTPEMAAFLWMVVESKRASLIVTGQPASGKTSFLSSLLAFIPRGERVISIEEEMNELRFYDRFVDWIPLRGVYEERKTEAARTKGATLHIRTALDQVTNALRMRPDRIVLGEMRGGEARELFSGANLGFPFMATMHSNELGFAVIKRLLNPPMNVPLSTVSMLDVVISTTLDSDRKRRVVQLSELNWGSRGRLDGKEKPPQELLWRHDGESLFLNPLYSYDFSSKAHAKGRQNSKLLCELSGVLGIKPRELGRELAKRAELLSSMADKGTFSFFDVGKCIENYSKGG